MYLPSVLVIGMVILLLCSITMLLLVYRQKYKYGNTTSLLLQSAIFNNTFQLQGLLAPDGTLLDANQTALEFAGIDKTAVLGKKFWTTPWWYHDQALQRQLQTYITRCAAGELIRFEATHRDGAGRLRTIDATLKPLKDESGTVIYLIPEGRDITDLKTAESSLQEKNILLETLFESIPFDIWIRDTKGCLLLQNDLHARHYNVSIGNTAEEDLVSPELCRLWKIAQEQALEGYTLDLELRENDKIYRTIVAPIKHDNQITAIFGLHIDVTDRFTAMEALRSSEKRFKAIFEESPIAISITELTNRRCVDVNHSFCVLSGYRKEGIVGKTLKELGLLWNPDDDVRLFKKLTDNGIINGEEVQTRTATGEQRTGILYVRIIMIDKRAHAISLYQDTTEQKRIEEQLESSEATYKAIFNNAPIGIFQSVTAGQFISVNTVFARIFGYTSPEEMMKLVQDIPKQIYASAEQRKEIISRLHEKETLVVDDIQFLRKDGTRFYATVYMKGIYDSNSGEITQLDGFVVDTTEHRKTLEIMLQHEKMLMISGLAAGMAHEINNPLGIIAQDLQNLQRRLSSELPKNRQVAADLGLDLTALQQYLEQREIPSYLASMQEAARRASRIMDNMLQFSRSSGTDRHPAPLFDVLEHALELAATDYDLRRTYHFSSINLVRNYTRELPLVAMNVTEIEQVLINLLKNAAQALHTWSGESPKEIRISACPNGTNMVITVEDNGPGMTDEVRRRVFEPFFTTKEIGRGTGLGLAVSHAIITKNHNGLLTVSSSPGKGSCFTISLPIS